VFNLLVLSMHEPRYQIDVGEKDMSISNGPEMSAFYTSSEIWRMNFLFKVTMTP